MGYPTPMGLFQKKKLEDEVAVVPRSSQVPSSAPPTNPQGRIPSQQNASQRPSDSGVSVTPQQPAPAGYTIDRLVSLMRELPNNNVELVVRVLKKTLESVNISVTNLIQQAGARESELEDKMAGHRRAISALEEEIASKKRSIEELEFSYKEIMVVKERLNLAQTLEQHGQVSVSGAPPGTLPQEEIITTIVGTAETPVATPTVSDPRSPHKD